MRYGERQLVSSLISKEVGVEKEVVEKKGVTRSKTAPVPLASDDLGTLVS